MFNRIPEPELMEDNGQCEYYNQSLLENSDALTKFIETYKEKINVEQGTVIDLGTGTANFVIALCNTYPKLNAVCYEASEAMIKIAKINIAKHNLQDRITIIKDNFFNATGIFDVVIANRVLHHVNDTDKFWKLVNTLSKNILVCDLERPDDINSIKDWFDIDVQNSFKAAYNVNEVQEQLTEYGYSILRESIGYGFFNYTVYQKR
jgi:trans-aconitate methyltransferase